jgi:hypothetical protein
MDGGKQRKWLLSVVVGWGRCVHDWNVVKLVASHDMGENDGNNLSAVY